MADQPAALPPVEGRPPPAEPVEPSTVYASRPLDPGEELLVEKFYEQYAGQNAQMDALAGQMLTVELAVPGIYASILALLRGQQATLPAGPLLLLTFGAWFIALALTMIALFPRQYRVDPALLRADAAAEDGVLGIMDFFRRPARTKWWLLAAAAVVFWVGIGSAVWLLFG